MYRDAFSYFNYFGLFFCFQFWPLAYGLGFQRLSGLFGFSHSTFNFLLWACPNKLGQLTAAKY
jgi:hypothetical protein